MKNRKKVFILTEVILAVLVVLVAFLMIQVKTGKAADKISIIVQNADDGQWAAFKYGVKMAAMDQNVETFVVSTGAVLTEEEQQKLIKQEIESGADAVIVQPAFGESPDETSGKVKSKVPAILVESAASSTDKLSVVEPDHYAMGKDLAEELLRDYNGNVEGKTLGIVSETDDSQGAIQRRAGFWDTLKAEGMELRWSLNISGAKNRENLMTAQTTVDVVAALDDSSLTLAGKCSLENNLHGSVVYGIGNSTDGVYYLENSAVECLVVPDEFMMGYESVTEIAEHLKNPFRKMESKTVSHSILRKDRLFSEENQELLYSMSQ